MLIGAFACGYGVRAYISRRRHRAARSMTLMKNEARFRRDYPDEQEVLSKLGRGSKEQL
jgi:hypothetical protein